jgi:tRNA A37 methylthiotransferase MiaB
VAVEGGFRVFINQLGGNWVLRQQEALQRVLLHPKVGDIHIPIQTVSDRLLVLMGRETGIGKLAPFLKALGRGRAGRVLRTDMLVGFPSETAEEFEETLVFILEHFDEVAVYGFELHPFTAIAASDAPRVDRATIESRVERALAAIRSARHDLPSGRAGWNHDRAQRHKAQLRA